MTTNVQDQNCANCYFVRRVPTMITNPGKPGRVEGSSIFSCRFNPPPWQKVHASDWCACWSEY